MVLDPVFAASKARARNVRPASVDKSMFTFPTIPVVLQVIVAGEPLVQLLPPFGEMTVIMFVGVIGSVALKGVSWWAARVPCPVTRKYQSLGNDSPSTFRAKN